MNFETLILSFNHPQITSRTIESALKLVPASSIHLVHNGSRPDFADELTKRFPTIHHHVLEKNVGFTGGANFGLKSVFQNSEWCLFLTNDCLLDSVSDIQKSPGLYAPLIFRRNTKTVDSFGGYFNPKQLKIWHNSNPSEVKKSKFNFYVPGTAFVLHKKIFEAAGGFDEALFTYWEDVDYSVRVQKMGLPVDVIPGFTIRHSVGKTCHKDSQYTNYFFQRNRYRICRKHGASRFKILFAAGHRTFQQVLRRDWARVKQSLSAYLDA